MSNDHIYLLVTSFLALFLGDLRPHTPAGLAAPLEAVGTGRGAGSTSPPTGKGCFTISEYSELML